MYRFFPIRIKFFGTIQQNKKGLSLRASLFLFLSSNEVKSRFEPLYLATMPLTTSICFFRHAACAHQTPQREFAKAAFCLYQMLYPKGVADVNRFIARICFPARFFTPSLSVKNIYHHKFYNKKAFFTQKNLFFTQFCYVLFIQFDKIYYYRLIFVIECVKIHYKYNKFDKICVVLSRFYGGQIEPANFRCADSGSIDCNRIQIGKVHQRHDFRQNSGGLA